MQEQDDSEEGEAPADPSAGEWLQAIVALAPGRPGVGCVAHRRPPRAMSAGQCRRAAQRPWGLRVTSSPGGRTRNTVVSGMCISEPSAFQSIDNLEAAQSLF